MKLLLIISIMVISCGRPASKEKPITDTTELITVNQLNKLAGYLSTKLPKKQYDTVAKYMQELVWYAETEFKKK